MSDHPDVLIIGGGPAGTTAGAHLARDGHDVVLLEKGAHPRFHIGESLLPMNLPILERLGVLDAVQKLGVVKRGADFTCGDEPDDYNTYRFDRALGDSPGHAFEVRRDDFDALLFANCRRAGVRAFENHRVVDVALSDCGSHSLLSRDADGALREWRPRLVLDASGREGGLAARNRWRRKNPRHASAAVFGHFTGVERRPGADAGNISVYWFDHGWLWMIPLPDGVMSVGAVCWPEYLKTRRTDPQRFLLDTVASCPAAAGRIADAVAVGPVRMASNYSYRAERLWGEGYLLLGDAFAFVDPVFSSGVYLAMHSAESAIAPVQAWLGDERRAYRRRARAWEKRIVRGLDAYSWFIYRFTSPAMRNLFRAPRNLWQVEQAVVSMLAGDVFGNRRIDARLMFFRLIYAISYAFTLRDSFRAWRDRLRNAAVDHVELTATDTPGLPGK
ncbi:MAG: FAD-dependent oxidoreductase [Pseudomonadota bacterium]